MNRSESIVKLSKAILEAQRTMGDATKGSKNPFFKSSYADLNAIRETVTPALNSQGISILQPTVSDNGRNYVETILLHESGEYIAGYTEIKNTDGKPQSEGSGISYARRYGLQSMLNVGAVDDDGESAQGRSIKKDTKNENLETKPETRKAATKTETQVPATDTTKSSSTETLPSESANPFTDTKVLRQKIRSILAVLEAKKKVTKQEFAVTYLESNKDKVAKLSPEELNSAVNKKIDSITDAQVITALVKLKTINPELGL